MCAEKKPNLRDLKKNLLQPMPWGRKLGLILKNTVLKMVRFQNCCGHHGQPGC